MRHNKNQSTYLMITAPEIPRLANGGVALCHLCQRSIRFAGGFMKYLIEALEHKARYPHSSDAWSKYW